VADVVPGMVMTRKIGVVSPALKVPGSPDEALPWLVVIKRLSH
jgi:hypothetical protein